MGGVDCPVTVEEAAELALRAEREDDIAVLLDQLHLIMPILRRSECKSFLISQHPIVRLYVDQMHHLSHKCLNGHAVEKHIKAVVACKRLVTGIVPLNIEPRFQLTMLELL